jgi:dihydroorotate dehydrogenase
VTVNISSPNTKGLRDLQQERQLDELLDRLASARERLARSYGRRVPLALKVAPDLEPEEIRGIADAVLRHRFDAVIATNTTLSREGVEGLPHAAEAGGLSGAPVLAKSTAVLAAFRDRLGGKAALIGAGGILSGDDARKKVAAGAALVQLYTGLIYRGPALVRECVSAYPAK